MSDTIKTMGFIPEIEVGCSDAGHIELIYSLGYRSVSDDTVGLQKILIPLDELCTCIWFHIVRKTALNDPNSPRKQVIRERDSLRSTSLDIDHFPKYASEMPFFIQTVEGALLKFELVLNHSTPYVALEADFSNPTIRNGSLWLELSDFNKLIRKILLATNLGATNSSVKKLWDRISTYSTE